MIDLLTVAYGAVAALVLVVYATMFWYIARTPVPVGERR